VPTHSHKDNVQLEWDNNKRRLRAEGACILAEIMNEAINEMTTQFNEALGRGEILQIGGTRREMQGYLAIAAQRQLGVGDESR
jgi:hypothetical protein